jgi:protein gp37
MDGPQWTNTVRFIPESLELPLRWKKPRRIFVDSMSDLFHRDVTDETIDRIRDVMRRAHWHTFQVLTKRSERLVEHDVVWPPNVWMGVSVEDQWATRRIVHLREVRARVRFLSIEPLIGPIDVLDLAGIDWVIVGGESGPGARPMHTEWVLWLRDKCAAAGVPFFFKQWGGVRKAETGRVLEGRTWDQMPELAVPA